MWFRLRIGPHSRLHLGPERVTATVRAQLIGDLPPTESSRFGGGFARKPDGLRREPMTAFVLGDDPDYPPQFSAALGA